MSELPENTVGDALCHHDKQPLLAPSCEDVEILLPAVFGTERFRATGSAASVSRTENTSVSQ